MDDAYEKIGSIVEKWCEENMYTTMLVTISIGYEWETPHEETHLLEWDGERCELVWEVDWWEGQQHVELVGFAPTYKIRLVGADAEVATVQRWIPVTERLPEPGVPCICWCKGGTYGQIRWYGLYYLTSHRTWAFYDNDCIDNREVTHWMYRPEPPKEETE